MEHKDRLFCRKLASSGLQKPRGHLGMLVRRDQEEEDRLSWNQWTELKAARNFKHLYHLRGRNWRRQPISQIWKNPLCWPGGERKVERDEVARINGERDWKHKQVAFYFGESHLNSKWKEARPTEATHSLSRLQTYNAVDGLIGRNQQIFNVCMCHSCFQLCRRNFINSHIRSIHYENQK